MEFLEGIANKKPPAKSGAVVMSSWGTQHAEQD